MKEPSLTPEIAASQFGALAHETRLTVFRAVMSAGPSGVSAGDLAEQAQVTPSNLSAHLTVLVNAGLLHVRKDGRRRFYSATLPAVSALLDFLILECCDGHPEICNLAVSDLQGLRKTAC